MSKQIATLAACLCLAACTDAKQSGATYAPSRTTTTTAWPAPTIPLPTIPAATIGNLPVDCDPNKDFAALNFPDNIKACLAAGHMFNYDGNVCTSMGKALWSCDFATLAQNLTDLELSTGPLDAERSKGGKLIGCGASNDGLRLIAQFFYRNAAAPAGDCRYSALGKVVSVCFQKFVDQAPMSPTGDAAKRAYVAGCMAE